MEREPMFDLLHIYRVSHKKMYKIRKIYKNSGLIGVNVKPSESGGASIQTIQTIIIIIMLSPVRLFIAVNRISQKVVDGFGQNVVNSLAV